ncbi:MAG TPA: hypothetical protein VGD67_17110 [Pseudonocardiaceae bacterium]
MIEVRAVARVAGVFLAVASWAVLGVQPVAGAAVDQGCVVNEVVTLNPPVTDTPQSVQVTVNGQLVNCTNGSATTGSYTETATLLNYTCTSLFYQGSGTRVLEWNNPGTAPSSYDYNRTSSRVGGNIVILLLGSIGSGTFVAAPAKMQLTALQPNPLLCATTGVSQLTLLGALTIGV